MKVVNLDKLNKDIDKFVRERDWDQFHSVKNLCMALSVETSELLEIFQWMSEKESNLIVENQRAMDKVQDEISDIFIYLMRILSKTNIDLESAVRLKMKKNEEKYPIQLSKGNSKKYDEF